MVITCRRCKALINVPAPDRVAGFTTCEQCGTLLDVPETESGRRVMARDAAVPRAALALPRGLEVSEQRADPSPGYREGTKAQVATVITRRHRTARVSIELAVVVAAFAALIGAWVVDFVWFASIPMVLFLWPLTAVVLVRLERLMRLAVNRTEVRADPRGVHVWHGPRRSELLPADVLADDLVQIFSCARERFGSGRGPYQVKALLRGDVATVLVDGLERPEQALYVEQRLEHALGSTDRAVAGELSREQPAQESLTGRPADLEREEPFVPRSLLRRIGVAALVSAIPALALAVFHWPSHLGDTAVGETPASMALVVDAARPEVYFVADVERHMLTIDGRCGRQGGCDMSPTFDFVMVLRRDDGSETHTLRCGASDPRWGIGPSRSTGGRMYEEWWSFEMDDCELRLPPGRWTLSVQRETTRGGYEGDRIVRSRLLVESRRW